jgi:hypothetical protein
MSQLYLSRDLFYFAFCCFGFSVGCILSFFTVTRTKKQRSWSITAAILWFSATIVFLTAAIVVSSGDVLSYKSFFVVGMIIFVLACVSFRFPKYVGFPFILVLGFFVVMFAFSFLRFPLIKDASFLASETNRLVFRLDESNNIAVRILRSSAKDSSKEFALFEPQNWEDPLSILACDFYIDEAVPIAGGQIRSTAAKIMQNGSIIYTNPMISRIPFQDFFKNETRKPFVLIKEYERNVSIEEL